jgi:peptidyl-prolyl cis-trans isomerase C
MVPEFDRVLTKLEIGDISDPVETEFGFHVILRSKVDLVSAKHILIQWKGKKIAGAKTISRSKDEALKLINEIKAKIDAGGDFEELAKEFSEGPSATKGGDLGEFGRVQMVPEFTEVAFALELEGVSDAVETQFGYHLIYRYE